MSLQGFVFGPPGWQKLRGAMSVPVFLDEIKATQWTLWRTTIIAYNLPLTTYVTETIVIKAGFLKDCLKITVHIFLNWQRKKPLIDWYSQRLGWFTRKLDWVEKANPKRWLTVWCHSHIILKGQNFRNGRQIRGCQGQGLEARRKVGVGIKRQHRERLWSWIYWLW